VEEGAKAVSVPNCLAMDSANSRWAFETRKQAHQLMPLFATPVLQLVNMFLDSIGVLVCTAAKDAAPQAQETREHDGWPHLCSDVRTRCCLGRGFQHSYFGKRIDQTWKPTYPATLNACFLPVGVEGTVGSQWH
jgi:hypothetical protein